MARTQFNSSRKQNVATHCLVSKARLWHNVFVSAMPSDFSFDLSTISVKTQTIQLNDSSFDTLIKELNPDVVLFDRFMIEEQYGWRVMENCPNALRILDTEDLHFLRKAREVAFKQNRELVFIDYISDVFKREMASMYRCDLTLLISEYEIQLATKHSKLMLLFVLFAFYIGRN